MSVCCECCVLFGRGLCVRLITRPEESYRRWCVAVCDLETSWMGKPWPALGRSATRRGGVYIFPSRFLPSRSTNFSLLLYLLHAPAILDHFNFNTLIIFTEFTPVHSHVWLYLVNVIGMLWVNSWTSGRGLQFTKEEHTNLIPWTWRQNEPSKRWHKPTRLQGATNQNPTTRRERSRFIF